MYTSITTNLMVESVDESARFYEDILGFSTIASVPNSKGQLQFAIMAKDSLHLMFQEKENLIAEYPILTTPIVQPSVTLYIKTNNLDALYQELCAKTDILCAPHTTFYGATEFAIADNNGYVITFTS